MPYLAIRTNQKLTDNQVPALLQAASNLVASELGKPERYVMIELADGLPMMFGGSDSPLAYLELKNIGLNAGSLKSLSAKLSALLEQHIKIPADRIYIEFTNINGSHWGFNGGTF